MSAITKSLERSVPAARWPAFFLAGAFVIFVGLQFVIWHVNGLWLDEVYSIWASDPSSSFHDDFVHRIAPDTIPPGYYSLLYVTRLFVSDGRTSAIILNGAVLASAAILILLSARRTRLVPFAMLCIGAFLLGGPVVYYMPEARSYLAALALTFVVSWHASLRLTRQDVRPFTLGFAALGIFAALIHLYASLFCCCLAAGMLAVALRYPGRRFLLREAFVLGLSAGLVSCLWLITVRNSFGRVSSWLHFDLHTVLGAIGSVFMLNGGPALLVILIALALLPADCKTPDIERRSLTTAFSVAYLLFFVVPIVASFKQHMVVGRYWLIGSPGLIVFIIFQSRELLPKLFDGRASGACRKARVVCAALATLWVFISAGCAYARFADKTVWRGVADVKPLIAECPSHSVHIGMGLVEKDRFYLDDGRDFGFDVPQLFGALAGVSPNLFVPITGSDGPLLAARDAKCPVVGWAEHLNADALKNLSDADLLRLLKIEASNNDVDIRRHKSGYVVLLANRR
jgi:hypothetical protein